MADEPEHTEPAPEPARPLTEAPEWATRLQQTLEELPAKLRATVSDDDKESIGEHVYRFFERGGAFQHHSEPAAEDTEEETEAEVQQAEQETEPKKQSGMGSFASWFAGDE